MTWNYRLVRRKIFNSILQESEEYIEIKEVYYDEENKPILVGDAPVPCGENIEEIRQVLNYMQSALNMPVLNYHDIVKED